MKKFSLCLLLMFSVCAGARAANVTFGGNVVNGSQKERGVPNATVQFLRVNEEGASQTLATTKSDARGQFKIKAVDVHANDLVFARVDWGGYPYITPAYDGAGRTGAPIDSTRLHLHIYDTTETAPAGMTFVAHHIALKDDGDNLKLTERIVVENPSNKTFIGLGKEGITLGLSLPKGAKNVAIDESIADAKLIKIGKKPIYAVSKPITPTSGHGASTVGNAIIINYTLPWSKKVDLSRQLLYPEKFFFVVREEADKDKILVEAPLLGKDTVQPIPIDGQMQNRVVKMVGAPQSPQPVLAAGQQMEIYVTRPVSNVMWSFVALTAGLCVFLPALMFFARRKPGARNTIEYSNGAGANSKSAEPFEKASVYSVIHSPNAPNNASEVADLVEKLAVLDDDFAAGKIEERDYQTQRAQWKTEVVALMKSR